MRELGEASPGDSWQSHDQPSHPLPGLFLPSHLSKRHTEDPPQWQPGNSKERQAGLGAQSASPNTCVPGMPARKEVGGRGRGGSASGSGHLHGRSGGQRWEGPRHGSCKPNLKTKENKKSKNTDRRMPEPEALDSISFQMFSQQENPALLLPPQIPSSIKTPSIGEIQTEPLSLKQGGENTPSRPWDTPPPRTLLPRPLCSTQLHWETSLVQPSALYRGETEAHEGKGHEDPPP